MKVPVRLGDTVTGEVTIRRPVQDVYDFYRDFSNLPRFLGDVAVEQVADTTYLWIGKFPDREVAANLARLTRLLEAGQGGEDLSGPAPTVSGRPEAPSDREPGGRPDR